MRAGKCWWGRMGRERSRHRDALCEAGSGGIHGLGTMAKERICTEHTMQEDEDE